MEISQSHTFQNIFYNENTKINATIDIINDEYYQLTLYKNNDKPQKNLKY